MIPIEYISKIDIAISTLDDLKIEFEFRKSCAEALCDDFF